MSEATRGTPLRPSPPVHAPVPDAATLRPNYGGHPRPYPEGTVSTAEAAEAVGVTYRQLNYWVCKGWIDGSLEGSGSGHYRRWTPAMVRRARALAVASAIRLLEINELADWLVAALADASVAGVVAARRAS